MRPAGEPHAAGRLRRAVRRAAWLPAGAPLAAWGVAATGTLNHRYLIAAAALGPFWILCGVVAIAPRGRHRWLAAAGVAAWSLVALTGVRASAGPVADDGTRVVAVNLLRGNPDPRTAVAEILSTDADVLVTSETTRFVAGLIRASGRYPVELQGTGPARDVRIWGRAGAVPAGHVTADEKGFPRLRVDGIEIVGIHVTSPVEDGDLPRWHAEYRDLRDWIHGRSHVVLAGDFNASLEHRPLARLGLRAASRAGGAIFPRTWPAAFPLIGIDHVLVSDGVAVGRYREFTIPGSDHHGAAAVVGRLPALR